MGGVLRCRRRNWVSSIWTRQVKFQRETAPIFDVIVELKPDEYDSWTIYRKVGDVVDAIYAGKPYEVSKFDW